LHIPAAIGNIRPVIPINLIRSDPTDPSFRANQIMNHFFEVIAFTYNTIKVFIFYDHSLRIHT